MFIIFSTGLTLILSGCQSFAPPVRLDKSLQSQVITEHYQHFIIHKAANTQSPRLHVYIEGDGLPFRNRFEIAKDPGPGYPLTVDLMKQDPANSINLGRPCYFSANMGGMEKNCSTNQWTFSRYSAEIIDDMVAALRHYLTEHPAQGITLIGYSGGGTIAMLMAARMPEIDQLVTVAGGLNTRAWTDFHTYTPLKGSLNPATEIKLAAPAHQIHITGAKDDNIPAALAEKFLAGLGQHYIVVNDADHDCCWVAHWPELLILINQQMHE